MSGTLYLCATVALKATEQLTRRNVIANQALIAAHQLKNFLWRR